MTEILHHLLTCLSTLSLGVRGYKLCISKCKLIEVVQDFFHPPKRKKRNSWIFGLANFFPPSATSRGSIPSSVLLIVPPVCFTLHLHTAEHEQNKLHGSRRTQHCKPPATPTLHYTQHCRNAAPGSISGQDRKIVLYFHFIP